MQIGSYQVLFELGRGGMGRVYLGRTVGAGGFERLVAIKRAHPNSPHSAELSQRFLNEARLAGFVHHANVVSMQVPPLTALPAELTALVARTLSKSVDGRPRSASVVSSELRRIGAALDAKEGNPPPTELIPAAPNRSNVWLLAVLAIVVIVAAWFVFNP